MEKADLVVIAREMGKIQTRDEVSQVIAMIRQVQSNMSTKVAMTFMVGEKVSFDSKYGTKVEGTITKINSKTIKLTSTTNQRWTVSPALLKKI
jgi:hypothetical protein